MPLRLFVVWMLWWLALIPSAVGAAFFGAWLQRRAFLARDPDALYKDVWLDVDEAMRIWGIRDHLYDVLDRDRVPLGGAITPGAEDYVIRAVLEACAAASASAADRQAGKLRG